MLERRRSAEGLDFQKVGISLKVKVKIGLVYDFSDLKTLRRYIQEGRVTPEDTLSADGQTWRVIGNIPDLDTYITELYEKAEADLRTQGGGEGFEEDEPTTIIGMGNLGNNLAEEALRQLTNGLNAPAPPPPVARDHRTNDLGGRDPFAALIQQQQQRRPPTRSSTKRKPAKTKTNRSGMMVAALALLVFTGWWFTRPPSQVNIAETTTAGPTTTTMAAGPVGPSVQQQLDALMQEVQAEQELEVPDEYEEETLVAVIPEEFRNGATPSTSGIASSGFSPPTNPLSSSQTSTGNTSGLEVRAQSASDLVQLGDSMASQYDWSGAANAYSKAAGMSGDASILLKYGKALYHAGDLSNAQTQLSQASNYPEASKYLARIFRDWGDDATASQHYRDYLAKNPNDSIIQQEYERLGGTL